MESKFTTSLIERLKLMERFSQVVPQTMVGTTIVEKYKKIFENQQLVSDFHNLLLECNKSGDRVLTNWSTQIADKISVSDPNGWYLNMIFEKLSLTGNSINEAIVDDLQYLSTFNESDLSEAIANGALDKNLMVGDLKILHERITGIKTAKQLLENNIMYSPISYIESRNGSKFFMIEGRVYEDSENGLVETQAPSAEFAQVNSAIQTIPYNPAVDEFELNFLPGAVNVTSGGEILKDKEPWDIQQLQAAITESCKNEPNYIKILESKKFDALNTLMEHWDSVIKMDNVTAVKNTESGNCAYLFEHANMNYIITKSGVQYGTKSLNEAIGKFNNIVGINMRGIFGHKLNEEMKARTNMESINESVYEDITKYEKIINECKEEMSFCEKDSEHYSKFKSIMEDANEILSVLNKTILK